MQTVDFYHNNSIHQYIKKRTGTCSIFSQGDANTSHLSIEDKIEVGDPNASPIFKSLENDAIKEDFTKENFAKKLPNLGHARLSRVH